MEVAVFIIFCIMLILCVITGSSVVLALLAGLLLFIVYGLIKGFRPAQLLRMCADGIRPSLNIIITMLIIGALTALWRASGCIPAIVCYASGLIRPSVFLLLAFLLNALISTLTGTAFGTVATKGVICASIGKSMGIPVFWTGGAVLAGSFVGDRCSPVSTSALLVCTVTGTDIYSNMRNMFRSALLPFFISCAVYLAAGFTFSAGSADSGVRELFGLEFATGLICLIPAAVILVLALFKAEVKLMMALSIVSAVPVCIFVQHQPVRDVLVTSVFGYEAAAPEVAGLINGGGILSMVSVSAVILIASCYAGIFRETGLLDFMLEIIEKASAKRSSFFIIFITSVAVSAISCNQTLATMLTDQLTSGIEKDPEKRALFLEDTVIVVSPLIPWSIAASVPLAAVEAPVVSILAAVYLYALPLAGLVRYRRRREEKL